MSSFTEFLDLASEKLGGKALLTSDDFFAPMQSMLKVEPAVFIPGKYTEFGKWMDGWESRRKRNLGPGNDHDWCVVKLAVPGVLHGVIVDTAFFTGNFPESCAIDGLSADQDVTPANVGQLPWKEIVPMTRLKGDAQNPIAISDRSRYALLRLRIYPDGGVARFRVHGEPQPDWARVPREEGLVDLAAALNGANTIAANDMHYGLGQNMLFPGRAAVMGEGWETRRRRGIDRETHDWNVVRLAAAGRIKKVEVDTNHFKGNFPESCRLEGLAHPARNLSAAELRDRKDLAWQEILPRSKLQAHHRHYYSGELKNSDRAFDYVRLSIYPDGGISRLRVWGEKA